MKESYSKGLATHADPESCANIREGAGEALTGARAGWVLSRESVLLRGADVVRIGGRQHWTRRNRETSPNPARSKTPYTYGNTSRENRDRSGLPLVDGTRGRIGKSKDARR